MRVRWTFWLMFQLSCLAVHAQVCPSEGLTTAKTSSTLHGKLISHEDLRQWLELKLDQQACGWGSVQVNSGLIDLKEMHRFRDCGITITGNLFKPMTGYYSLGLAVDVDKIRPDDDCKPHPVQPDLSKYPIPATVKSYMVTIRVDYRDGGHIDVKVSPTVRSTVTFTPWQAYARYSLTGSPDVIWFDCAHAFEVAGASQSPKMGHRIFLDGSGSNSATFDLKSGLNTLIFQCRRPQ